MFRCASIAACLALLTAWPTQAAAAVAFTQSHITAETDLDNSGNLVAAMNLDATGHGPATIDGIPFGIANTIGTFTNWLTYTTDVSDQFPIGSPLDTVLSNLWFQPTNVVNARINVANLVTGHDYRVQLLIAHQSTTNLTGRTPKIEVQGESITLADVGTTAALVTINFTATGPSETITFGNGSDAQVDRAILNAIAVHEQVSVPAPSAIALLGLLAIRSFKRNGRVANRRRC